MIISDCTPHSGEMLTVVIYLSFLMQVQLTFSDIQTQYFGSFDSRNFLWKKPLKLIVTCFLTTLFDFVSRTLSADPKQPRIIWLQGPKGSGKTTALYYLLHKLGGKALLLGLVAGDAEPSADYLRLLSKDKLARKTHSQASTSVIKAAEAWE